MNKKYLKIVAIIILVVLLAVIAIYFVTKNNGSQNSITEKKVEIMSEAERGSLGLYHLGVYEVVSRDEAGKIKEYRLIRLQDEKPIAIEFMTNEEKKAFDIQPSLRIQVVRRDTAGKAIAYRYISKDSDILTKY